MNTLIPLVSIILFSITSLASNTTVSKPDPKNSIYVQPNFKDELSSLDLIEDMVKNGQVNIDSLEKNNPDLVINLDKNAASIAEESPLGIPPLVWGLCCGWVGILIVYIMTDNDKEQVKKSVKGFLIGIGVYVGLYLLYFALVLSVGVTSGY
ncbi:MAG: hypothetical protein ACRCVT_00260 [Leadbetterella sp.]